MIIPAPARYEEWLEFCFGRFTTASRDDDLWVLTRHDDLGFVANEEEIVQLYTATMLRSGRDLAGLSNLALEYGLSLMFEHHFGETIFQYCNAVSDEELLAIEKLFCDCIDQRNLPIYRGNDPLSHCRLGWAVFDFWDNSILNAFEDVPRQAAILTVMESTLKLSSQGCIQCALHGLGHQRWSDNERVDRIIGRFLAERLDISSELRDYAVECQTGNIL